MQKYRDLFEREFSGNLRLFDIAGPGLNLGLPILELPAALEMLGGGNSGEYSRGGSNRGSSNHGKSSCPASAENITLKNKIAAFIKEERGILLELRGILSGEAPESSTGPQKLPALLDACGYLWAHFPEYAGGVPRTGLESSFLNRVRVEIDPFIKQWNLAEQILGEYIY
jgi:hypothetical protein